MISNQMTMKGMDQISGQIRNDAAVTARPMEDGRSLTAYHNYAYVVGSIQAALLDKYGRRFEPYVCDDGEEDYWELLEQDVKGGGENGVEFVTRIYDHIESRAFGLADGIGHSRYEIFPTLRNNVFAYPDRGVALAKVPVFRQHGIGSEDFVFAVDDASLSAFLSETRERRRMLDRSQVTLFTDGPHGTEKTLSSITRMVDRDEVVMKQETKQDIFRSIEQFFSKDRAFFHEYRIPYKRGILLYGRPGNGKTTLVKSIAGSVRAPVAYWQITEHTCSDSMQEVFQAAAVMAPMILVIEDIDSMPERSRSYFLNMLDGATSQEGIFLIGTTNYPDRIDPALMNRAGRFDRAYEIKLPDAELRQAYLQQKGLGKLLGDDLLSKAAKLTESFTFAQLNELYVSAALEWHYDGSVQLEKLVKTMKADLHKGQTMSWMKEESEARIGFMAM